MHIYIYMYKYVCTRVYIYMYENRYICMCVCVCVCVCMSMSVRVTSQAQGGHKAAPGSQGAEKHHRHPDGLTLCGWERKDWSHERPQLQRTSGKVLLQLGLGPGCGTWAGIFLNRGLQQFLATRILRSVNCWLRTGAYIQ